VLAFARPLDERPECVVERVPVLAEFVLDARRDLVVLFADEDAGVDEVAQQSSTTSK
jgi:hypothetical protein